MSFHTAWVKSGQTIPGQNRVLSAVTPIADKFCDAACGTEWLNVSCRFPFHEVIVVAILNSTFDLIGRCGPLNLSIEIDHVDYFRTV